MQNRSRQIIASLRENTLVTDSARGASSTRTIRAVEIKRSNGNSFETVSFWTLIGLMMAATPINNKILIMLLPMTLPSKMSVLPPIREEKETASSGAPVPKATIVRPISSFETLKFEATLDAPDTSQSAPLIKKMKPTMSKMICRKISMFV